MDITDEFDSFLNDETNPVEQKKIDIKAKTRNYHNYFLFI